MVRSVEIARAVKAEPREPRHLPLTRGECEQSARPCPYVSCRQHLFADVTIGGAIRPNFDVDILELERLPETCALDVAARGAHGLDAIAAVMNLTSERVRQIELSGLGQVRRVALALDLAFEVGPPSYWDAGDG